MDNGPDSPLLSAAERPAAVVRNADGRGRAVLVCEHASRTIPAALNGLRDLGHPVSGNSPSAIGSVQAVVVEPRTGKQFGGADSRREGTVIGLPRSRGGR